MDKTQETGASGNVMAAKIAPRYQRVMAQLVSYVCHPVFFPLVMAYVVYRLAPAGFVGVKEKQLGLWMISIGMTTVFFPLFSIFLMKQLGFISSLMLPTAKERTIPLMATMIFYFWVSHVFNNMPGVAAPLMLRVLLLGNFWGIIALFMINIFTKISMHATAAGGMVGLMLMLVLGSSVNMMYPLLVSIVVAGLIGTARMMLGAHQRGDIWLGYIIGIISQVAAYYYMR